MGNFKASCKLLVRFSVNILHRAFRSVTLGMPEVQEVAGGELAAAEGLVEAAFPTFFSVASPTFFAGENLHVYMGEFLRFLRGRGGQENQLWTSVASAFDSLDVRALSGVMRYDSVYVTPWTPSAQEEEAHRRANMSIKAWSCPTRGENSGGGFDEALVMLVLLCSLFDVAEEVDEEEDQDGDGTFSRAVKDSAARTRERHLLLLSRYLRRAYGRNRARELLGEALRMDETAKTAYRIHSQMLPV